MYILLLDILRQLTLTGRFNKPRECLRRQSGFLLSPDVRPRRVLLTHVKRRFQMRSTLHERYAARRAAAACPARNEVRLCPPGPSDVTIHWLVDGHVLNRPVREHRQPLGRRGFLVSSWLTEGPLLKDARYRCFAEASTGSDMCELDVHLSVGGTRGLGRPDPFQGSESSGGAAVNLVLFGR